MTPEFNLDLKEMKGGFFSLMDGVTRMIRKHSEILGAQTRMAAKNSMKRMADLPKKMQRKIREREDESGGTKTGSVPPNPPLVHLGLLKQHIYYQWDNKKGHVVVGPIMLPRGLGVAPHALEFGNTTLIETFVNGNPVILRVHLEPRPYMVPALRRVMEPGNVERAYKKSLGKFVKSVKKKYT